MHLYTVPWFALVKICEPFRKMYWLIFCCIFFMWALGRSREKSIVLSMCSLDGYAIVHCVYGTAYVLGCVHILLFESREKYPHVNESVHHHRLWRVQYITVSYLVGDSLFFSRMKFVFCSMTENDGFSLFLWNNSIDVKKTTTATATKTRDMGRKCKRLRGGGKQGGKNDEDSRRTRF